MAMAEAMASVPDNTASHLLPIQRRTNSTIGGHMR